MPSNNERIWRESPSSPCSQLEMRSTSRSLFRFASLVLVLATFARPSFGVASPEDIALAKKYAPQFRFHNEEVYFASTVQKFLENVDLLDDNGTIVTADPTVLTVDDPPSQGSGLFLSTDIDANKDGWLRGSDPSKDPSNVAVYTFVARKQNGVADIYYWLFTPFNEGKDVPLIGQVGDHMGDWERLTVRTVDGVATQVDFHAHSDTGSTLPFSEAPKFDGNRRPIAYVARGSHGIWANAGEHTYVDAVVFKLKDITNDGGVYWDTRDSLATYKFPDSFSGTDEWLNYQGAWGNEGTTDCWWHIFHPECEVVTGPPGPYRTDVLGAAFAGASLSGPGARDPAKWDMAGSLSQTLGSVSDSDNSSFTIYLHITSTGNFVAGVNVTCSPTDADTAPQTQFGTNLAALKSGSNKLTVTPPGCPPNTKVTEYNVGLCIDPKSCQWSGRPRALKAHSEVKNVCGPLVTRAIEVEDLDTWFF